jgi:hypothetical protein
MAATWDGTQSGLLTKQRAVAEAALSQTRAGSKEYLAIQTEVAQLEVKGRQTAGQEIIANAREQISDINAATGMGAQARLTAESDVWLQLLAGDRLTTAQRVEVQRSFNQSIAALNKERVAQATAITRADANTDIAIARLKIDAEKTSLELAVQQNEISAGRKLQILKDMTNQEYALDLQRLQNEQDSLKDQPVEYDRVYNQIRELKAKLNLDLAALDKQAAADAKRQAAGQALDWKSAVGEIENVEGQLVSNLLSGRKSLAQSLLSLSADLVTKEIANDLKAYTTKVLLQNSEKALSQGGFLYHLMNSQKEVMTDQAAEATKTAAATAGETARKAAATAGAAATQAEIAATGPAEVLAYAAQAAAGAFAATAVIPFIGPELAPAAAAEAYSTVAAFAPMASFDVGAWNLPHDMTARVHKGETIMPANFAAGFRDAVSGGSRGGDDGSGGDTTNHFHISTVDRRGVDRLISNNGPAIAKSLSRQVNRNWRPKV